MYYFNMFCSEPEKADPKKEEDPIRLTLIYTEESGLKTVTKLGNPPSSFKVKHLDCPVTPSIPFTSKMNDYIPKYIFIFSN